MGLNDCRTPVIDDIQALAIASNEGYKNGIVSELFGLPDLNNTEKDLKEALEMYIATDTINQSSVVFDKDTNKIAGFCLSSAYAYPQNDDMDDFSGIASITVLPEYRNQGIAEYMIKHASRMICIV